MAVIRLAVMTTYKTAMYSMPCLAVNNVPLMHFRQKCYVITLCDAMRSNLSRMESELILQMILQHITDDTEIAVIDMTATACPELDAHASQNN